MPTTLTDIREFIALKRIALVGVSRDPGHFSRYLFHELCKQGYEVVPVNPETIAIENTPSFPRVQDIQPPVEGAILLTPPNRTETVVRDCAEAGIRRIWMHRSGGQGSVSPDAVDFCHLRGIKLVEGFCPFMFLPKAPFFHRVHGFILKLTGSYPKEQRALA